MPLESNWIMCSKVPYKQYITINYGSNWLPSRMWFISGKILSGIKEPDIGSSFAKILTCFHVCWSSGLVSSPKRQEKWWKGKGIEIQIRKLRRPSSYRTGFG